MPRAGARVARWVLEAGPPLGISRAVDLRDALQTRDSISSSESQAIKSSSTIPAFRLSVKSNGNVSVVKSSSVLGCPRGSDVLLCSAQTLMFGSNPREQRSQIVLTTSGFPYI